MPRLIHIQDETAPGGVKKNPKQNKIVLDAKDKFLMKVICHQRKKKTTFCASALAFTLYVKKKRNKQKHANNSTLSSSFI